MNQLRGIIFYELLMNWRRRTLPVVLVFFLAALLFIGYLVDQLESPLSSDVVSVRIEDGVSIVTRRVDDGSTVDEPLAAEVANQLPSWLIGTNLDQAGTTIRAVTVLISALLIIIIGMLPLLSDVVALDRQYRVRELLDTTPLHRKTYLGGKILGLWAGLSMGLLLCFVAFQGLLFVRYGGYDLLALVLLWLGLIEPLVLFISAGIVLLTSWAGSRRSALLTSIFLIPLGIYVYAVAIMSPLGNVARLVQPFYGLGLMDTYLTDPNYRAPLSTAVIGTLAGLALVGGGLWVVAWGFARLREAR